MGARDRLQQDWLRNGGRLQDKYKFCPIPETERSCTPRVSLSLMYGASLKYSTHSQHCAPRVCCRAAGQLARECERLLRDKAALKAQLR